MHRVCGIHPIQITAEIVRRAYSERMGHEADRTRVVAGQELRFQAQGAKTRHGGGCRLAQGIADDQQAQERLKGGKYGEAEQDLREFVRRFPRHDFADNAQYWLGESLYFRGQYRAAAAAYLKGYQNHTKSPKAAEALLRLGMSLQRLGQKDAACNSFNELTAKFPNAPGHVKSTATAERQRAGCT